MYERIQIPLFSLADICREIGAQMGAEAIEHEGRYITYPNPGFLYARHFILNASENEIEPVVREIRDGLSKGLPAGITFTAECVPENTKEILEKYGFRPFVEQIGMIFDLEDPFEDVEDDRIVLVPDEKMTVWSEKVASGFPKPFEDAPFIALNKLPRVLTYAYMDGDSIASTGMLLVDPELSGIHEISTQEAYRGKGQARAIILAMLKELKAQGIKSVSLQASAAGKEHVYDRIGFETVSTIETWLPPMPEK